MRNAVTHPEVGQAFQPVLPATPEAPLQFRPSAVDDTGVSLRIGICFLFGWNCFAQTLLQRSTLTYLGGSQMDVLTGVAVDAAGYIYVTGWTASPDLPVQNAWQPTFGGTVDAYVARFAPDGKTRLYCTYLGGSGDDRAFAIAVDTVGNAYVTGWTLSNNFPVSSGAYQHTNAGGQDVFITELNSAGTVVYSTYIGGTGQDAGNSIAVDSGGNILVAGDTSSPGFPVQNALQTRYGGGQDAFVLKMAAGGSALLFSTYLGGSLADTATAVAIDSSGYIYITGSTQSPNFPVLGPFQSTLNGAQDAFLTKIAPNSSALVYSSFLGGSAGSPEGGTAIAVDAAGAAYVAGVTSSSDFPILNAFQSALQGEQNAFLVKVSPMGNSLSYASYLGGMSVDIATSIALGTSGSVWIGGYTNSINFPTTTGQSVSGGSYDAFMVQLIPGTSGLLYSGLVGRSGSTSGNAIATYEGGIYFAGQTFSSGLADATAVQPQFAGVEDGFLEVFSQASGPVVTISSPASNGFYATSNAVVSLSGTTVSTSGLVQVTWTNDRGGSGTAIGTTAWSISGISLQSGVNDISITAQDSSGNRDTAAIQVNYTPSASVLITPNTGIGASQNFTAIYVYNAGLAGVTDAELLVQSGLNTVNACEARYNLSTKAFFLLNDAGTAWLGPLVPGSAASLQNSQCVLSGANSSAAVNGSVITSSFNLTFLPAFSGQKYTYLNANATWLPTGNWVVVLPPTASISPNSGGGGSQTFTATYNYPAGLGGVAGVALLLQSAVTSVNACEVDYDLNAKALFMLSDDGTAWLGPLAPGSLAVLRNSQCVLNGASSTASANGSTIIVSFGLTFSSAFDGQKGTYLWINNVWQSAGTWTVTPAQLTGSVSPNTGSGGSQIFTAAYNFPGGLGGLGGVALLVQSALTSVNACEVDYDLNTRALFMLSDGGGAWLGPLAPGSAAVLQNSQCILNGSTSAASLNGSTITVSFNLTFSSAFTGKKNTYLWINNTWQSAGTWTVAPAASISPNSGSGGGQIFTATYSYPGGLGGIGGALLVQSTLTTVSACEVDYDFNSKSLFLLSDDGTNWLGPLAPGSTTVLQNSQCILNGSTSAVSVNGSTITVSFSLTFLSTFAGPKNMYLWINNTWQSAGTWAVTLSQPTASIPLISGSGANQILVAAYNYPGGLGGVGGALLVQSTLTTVNACEVDYDFNSKSLFLLSDGGTVWLGPLPPGSAGILQNSQCTLNGSTSTVSLNGSTITVSFSLTFSQTFAGQKNTYLWINNAWQLAGTATVK